ncbi:MAG: glutathione metabolism protein [Deltaproteobacteria bacterium]|nr:glutathione metabolism protein [Deltaproteobacteria bacterium]MBU47831.1 glutathione metabolism protein [Deltaproteobacteria bacterium]
MYITPLYAALLSLVFVVLSFRVILLRQKLEVGIGDGGDKRLLRATRVHGNFAEYVPLALLLLFLLECQTKTTLWVHIGGSVLLAGRLLHAYGVSQVKEDLRLRVTGMAMNFCVIVGLSVGLLLTYVL